MKEFQFTFIRYSDDGLEEKGGLIEAADLDDATVKAQRFCERNQCRIKHVEWYDEEDGRWQNSDVQYA